MSKASRGDPFLAEMNEGPEVDAVLKGHGKAGDELTEGLETLRSAYQEFWAETHPTTQILNADDFEPDATIKAGVPPQKPSFELRRPRATKPKPRVSKPRRGAHAKARGSRRDKQASVLTASRRTRQTKVPGARRQAAQRFGLPEGFVPRMQRFGRGVLLERNIYSLANGQEFIPCLPTGPLGGRHLYALLTTEQHLSSSRGSVYIRGDGKIFDYSVVSANPLGDIFDTGYTIHDLERTGRYAPEVASTSQTSQVVARLRQPGKQKPLPKKSRRAASGG
jgi:hypothetical protein